jgi:hypothetical protein
MPTFRCFRCAPSDACRVQRIKLTVDLVGQSVLGEMQPEGVGREGKSVGYLNTFGPEGSDHLSREQRLSWSRFNRLVGAATTVALQP